MKALFGFVSEATAYLVGDYPYGFVLRCQIRYWMEFNKRHGYRLVSQTTNPKRGNAWNKPKASTYADLGVMLLDENGHVTWDALSVNSSPEKYAEFKARFPDLPEAEAKRMSVMERVSRKYSPITWGEWEAKQAAPAAPALATEAAPVAG